jgi:hypothetical protein
MVGTGIDVDRGSPKGRRHEIVADFVANGVARRLTIQYAPVASRSIVVIRHRWWRCATRGKYDDVVPIEDRWNDFGHLEKEAGSSYRVAG